MQLKPQDLKTFDTYKKAMKAAALQIKDNTPFCVYSDVQLPDPTGKAHVIKPFLVIGSPVVLMNALLKEVEGTKKLACSGLCSLQGTRISLEPKSGKLNYGPFKTQAKVFKDLLGGKEILIPAGVKDEGDEDGDTPDVAAKAAASGAQAAGAAAAKPAGVGGAGTQSHPVRLATASTSWHGTRSAVDAKCRNLKKAIKDHYANEHPEVLQEIDKGMAKIDTILVKLDSKLAHSLQAASKAATEAARAAELRIARSILNEYRQFVTSDKLIGHIDTNPFLKLDMKTTLMSSLADMEKSIAG